MADRCPSSVPCPTCPWRRSSPGGPGIPGFDIAKARRLANTVGDGDQFRPVMACHYSEEGAEHACVGYLAVEGWTNLAVRVAVIDGRVDMAAVADACASLDLYGSFAEMLGALEAAEVTR